VVYRATASDTDTTGEPLTFALSGVDASNFNLNTSTGELTFRNDPQYSNPTDSNGDNQYVVSISARDGINSSAGVEVTITVPYTPDTYVVPSSMTPAIDVSGETPIFTLVGVYAWNFNAPTGELPYMGTPEFSQVTNSGGYNLYVIRTSDESMKSTGVEVLNMPDATTQLANAELIGVHGSGWHVF
jgi:hypothetical protein